MQLGYIAKNTLNAINRTYKLINRSVDTKEDVECLKTSIRALEMDKEDIDYINEILRRI